MYWGLIEDWVHGWALCRGAQSPVRLSDGYRIQLPDRTRYVLAGVDTVARRQAELTEPGTWLKVIGSRAHVVDALSESWELEDEQHMMVRDIGEPSPVPPPAGYHLVTSQDGPVWTALLRTGVDEPAARATVGVHDEVAVVDMVETEPAHRRRGLGVVLMAELMVLGAAAGATRAVLGATTDGRGLYERLGWRLGPDLVGARRR
ncbi:GNAT family N-acetyltransferase [Pseudonocardiaceae bacterium YIM PH 21723]|nr:GNAT family N-acetyltransferase [Pseudonocardiaceae bacterium YIM PH 21723]